MQRSQCLLRTCLVLVMVKYFFFYPSLEFQGWHFMPLNYLFEDWEQFLAL